MGLGHVRGAFRKGSLKVLDAFGTRSENDMFPGRLVHQCKTQFFGHRRQGSQLGDSRCPGVTEPCCCSSPSDGAAGLGATVACWRMSKTQSHLSAAKGAAGEGGAAAAAQELLSKWLSGEVISSIEAFPPAYNIDEVYAIHAVRSPASSPNPSRPRPS